MVSNYDNSPGMHIPDRCVISSVEAAFQFKPNISFQSFGIMESVIDRNSIDHIKKKYFNNNSSVKYEVMKTLFLTQNPERGNIGEKLMESDILFNDLQSMTDEDLLILGINNEQERSEILNSFKHLPNQYITYDQMCNAPSAINYNKLIFKKANNYLLGLQSALISTNYKLQLWPPKDVLIGNNTFASELVLKTLNELQSAADDLQNELHDFELLFTRNTSIGKVNKRIKSTWLILSCTIGLLSLFVLRCKIFK